MLKKLGIAIAVTLGISAPAHAISFTWSVEEGGNGHTYQLVTEEVTWQVAQTQAEELGGYLATLTSEEENQFVFNAFFQEEPAAAWIGLFQDPTATEPDQGFQWVTGETFEFTNWIGGEPNEFFPDEDFVELFLNNGEWIDALNTGLLNIGYIVEYNEAPNPIPFHADTSMSVVMVSILLGSLRLRKWRKCV